MSTLNNSNLTLAKEFINTFVFKQNFDIADDVFLYNCIAHVSFGMSYGPKMLVTKTIPWKTAFQLNALKIHNEIINNYCAVYELQFMATHIGPFKTIAATGKAVTINTTVMLDFHHSKIARVTVSADIENIIPQISAQKISDYQSLEFLSDMNSFDNVAHLIKQELLSNNIILSKKQVAQLCLWVTGKPDVEIAAILGVGRSGILSAMKALKVKFDCKNKADLLEKVKSFNFTHLLTEGFLLLSGNTPGTNRLILKNKINWL